MDTPQAETPGSSQGTPNANISRYDSGSGICLAFVRRRDGASISLSRSTERPCDGPNIQTPRGRLDKDKRCAGPLAKYAEIKPLSAIWTACFEYPETLRGQRRNVKCTGHTAGPLPLHPRQPLQHRADARRILSHPPLRQCRVVDLP